MLTLIFRLVDNWRARTRSRRPSCFSLPLHLRHPHCIHVASGTNAYRALLVAWRLLSYARLVNSSTHKVLFQAPELLRVGLTAVRISVHHELPEFSDARAASTPTRILRQALSLTKQTKRRTAPRTAAQIFYARLFLLKNNSGNIVLTNPRYEYSTPGFSLLYKNKNMPTIKLKLQNYEPIYSPITLK